VRLTNRYVPNEEVPSIFAQADVLVLPYVSASQSGVLRIAFANALPVIASTAGGLSEAVQDNVNGLLCPPRDARALADKIAHYFTANLGPVFAANLRAGLQGEAHCTIIEAIEAAAQAESSNPYPSTIRSEII
jgi:glycosyltransferase involved in cell wall biosynthesis